MRESILWKLRATISAVNSTWEAEAEHKQKQKQKQLALQTQHKEVLCMK